MTTTLRALLVLAFALALTAHAAAQGPARPDAYNVLYGAPEQGSRRLDVYLPPDAEPPYPVVLMFPGSDSRKQDMKDFGLVEIAIRGGAAAVAVAYDTSGPANAYADAWCALAWVQANAAEYRFDPAWIVTLGHSYGALPASMLAVQDDPALFAGDCPHPAADATAIRGAVTIGGALLGSAEALAAFTADAPLWSDLAAAEAVRTTPPEDWLSLDLDAAALDFLGQWPMARIDDYEPSHLLIHGAEDYTVLPQSSFDYAQILSRRHSNVTLVMDRYSGHVPPPFAYDLELLTFLERAFAAR